MGNGLTTFSFNKAKETIVKESCRTDPMSEINNVLSDFIVMKKELGEFFGTPDDRQFAYFDEMMTTFMLKLDSVDVQGKPEARQARKAAVQEIQQCIEELELRKKISTNNTRPNDVT